MIERMDHFILKLTIFELSKDIYHQKSFKNNSDAVLCGGFRKLLSSDLNCHINTYSGIKKTISICNISKEISLIH